jgi:hypothetical protein
LPPSKRIASTSRMLGLPCETKRLGSRMPLNGLVITDGYAGWNAAWHTGGARVGAVRARGRCPRCPDKLHAREVTTVLRRT